MKKKYEKIISHLQSALNSMPLDIQKHILKKANII